MSLSLQPKQQLKLEQILSPKLIAQMRLYHLSYADLHESLLDDVEQNVFLQIQRYDKRFETAIHEPNLASSESLHDVLTRQISLISSTDAQVAQFLIDAVDESGYIRNYSELSKTICTQLQVAPRKVTEILHMVQTFEPDGVGARSLKECLLIQLAQKDIADERLYELLHTVLTTYWDLLESPEALSKAIGLEDVTPLIAYIQSQFTPKPGLAYASKTTPPLLMPSFELVVDRPRYDIINLEQEKGTQLGLNPEYLAQLSDDTLDATTKAYLEAAYNAAKTRLDQLEQRHTRLTELVTAIISAQEPFVYHGPSYLNPLLQADLSAHLSLSASMVSRLVHAKSIQTPHGTFLLKQLCPRKRFGKTSVQLREIIRDLYDTQPERSDEQMRTLFKERTGQVVARRTLAKYRAELGISPRHKRF